MTNSRSPETSGLFDHRDALVIVFDITGATAFFADNTKRPVFNRAIERWVFAGVEVCEAEGGRLSAFTGDGMIICWPDASMMPQALDAAQTVFDLWKSECDGLGRQFADAGTLILRAGMARGPTETVMAPTSDKGPTATIQGVAVPPAKHVCDAVPGGLDALAAAEGLPMPDGAEPLDPGAYTGKTGRARPVWVLPFKAGG
ncbi:hypothetical protein [Hyphobacterium marinum]|uniref:Guanylate cyclase domain-containing protein n=1 Tax=Hyphobacterium marinum TaxID=3116574 RepID=A0ABU7LY01_9PROT|nr:hypothetical protein [Hyphobacterium sp. Y6023]MEE2566326.1 hypothetical protein [Hyphobacterium sp. Y6023]